MIQVKESHLDFRCVAAAAVAAALLKTVDYKSKYKSNLFTES